MLLAIHVPLVSVVSDSCSYIGEREQSVGGYAGVVRDVCLNNLTLTQALNLSAPLSLFETFNLPLLNATKLESGLQSLIMTRIQNTIDSLTPASFDQRLEEINGYISNYSVQYENGVYLDRSNFTSAAQVR